jgi:hypothetical protein
MRFLLLPLSVLAIAGFTSIEPPRPLVILVHGRGHSVSDSAALRRAWKAELDSGLVRAGLSPLANEDVRVAWYSDAMEPESDGSCVGSARPSDTSSTGRFARDFFGALAALIPDEAPEARSLVRDALYVMDPTVRCATQERVGRAIEAALAERRPVIIVAYSLGSLVTYGYLQSADKKRVAGSVRFVTVGSPLGNPELRGILGGADSLAVPASVSAWENVYDESDVFAAPMEIGGVRDRVAKRVNDSDAHGMGRYLSDPATGQAVGRALCAATKRSDSACTRLLALTAS